MGSRTHMPLLREVTSPNTASRATIRVENTVRVAMTSRRHPPLFPTRCERRIIEEAGELKVIFGDACINGIITYS